MHKLVLISLRQDFTQQIVSVHYCHWCNYYSFFDEILKLAQKIVFLLFSLILVNAMAAF